MTTPAMTELLPFYGMGQRVRVVAVRNQPHLKGKEGTFLRQLRKNVEVDIDGQVWRLDPRCIEAVKDDDGKNVYGQIPIEPLDTSPIPHPGQVVCVVERLVDREPRLRGLWIVGGGQGDKSRLFRLNNKDGRFWRIPNKDLIFVDDAVLTVKG